MKRKLIVTLAVEIEDFSVEERAEEAQRQGCHPRDLPRLKEVGSHNLANLVEGAVDNADEMFAGTDIYAKVKSIKTLACGFER